MSSTTLSPPLAEPGEATRPGPSKGRRRGRGKESATALVMFLPAAVLILTFLIIPIILTFILAFTNTRLISPEPGRFIGLENFSNLFTDDTFWASLRNTIIFTVVIVPVQSAIALGVALLVNTRTRGTTFFRTVYFLPVVTSIVVVSMLWMFMYQKDGLINTMLARIGIAGPDWLGDPNWSLFAIIVMSIWQAMGFHMIIWLSGLQTIPAELYEAASLDGATRWQQFVHVTWPGLRPTAIFILITITIAAFGLFSQVNIMTQGGPLGSTTTLVFMAVRSGFERQQTGYASAISLVFFVLVLIVTVIQMLLTREKSEKKGARS
ncbi:carbohydrate ABC transporter permease [Tessaracoccus palaemonis]|uniref:Sugar ABC transporter permease n=1 Tax=Tessaracoccus palaemonis TaxID=2829499 RepID=A0ABX8SH72_9ACTN|nr:sugar ABC transporter permease [Tessaracoccus palaemonis]QXT62666.1 sugar ABC transporter permease [Tessaracoccus palaemonis]